MAPRLLRITQALGLILFFMPMLAQAQQIFELPCPAGSSPLPNGVTYNQNTNRYRAWVCVDANGTVTTQGSIVSTNFFGIAVPLTGVRQFNINSRFVTPGAGANNVLYTVPAGKRILVAQITVYNDTGATSTFQPKINYLGAGTLYPIAPISGNVTAGGTGASFPENTILEATDVLTFTNTTDTTFNVHAVIIEFDASSPLKSARIISDGVTVAENSGFIVNGNAIVYTVPTGKSAMIAGGWALAATQGGLKFCNTTGTRTIIYNIIPSGASASTANRLGVFSLSSSTASHTGQFSMSAGDSVSINSTVNTVGQLLIVTYLEL